MSFSLLFSVVFWNVSCNNTRKEIPLYLVLFCPPKSINLFLYIQFLGFCWKFCRAVLKETEEIISFLAFLSVLRIKLGLFVSSFEYCGRFIYSTLIINILKPDLVSVVTVHMVYFCAFAHSEMFQKTRGN